MSDITRTPEPAPSSPDRIEAVAQALYGGRRWAEQLPWQVTYWRTMAAAAVAALDAYDREHSALWSCPGCAFTFSAEHTDPDGGLSCPVCESADLRERIAADPALADLMAQGMEEHRIAGATGAPWYKRPGGTRMGRDWQQTYACKCRRWEGTHSQHEAHVAAALTALITARIARGGQS